MNLLHFIRDEALFSVLRVTAMTDVKQLFEKFKLARTPLNNIVINNCKYLAIWFAN